MNIELYNEDCKETMKRIPDGSIDLMLTDPPYGITANEWDVLPNLSEMWLEWERILKPNGAWVIFCQKPFTADLIVSRRGFYKYCFYWDKIRPKNHLNAKIQPMRSIEEILIFYRSQPTYNPQYRKKRKSDIRDNGKTYYIENNGNYGKTKEEYKLNEYRTIPTDMSYPDDLISINGVGSFGNEKTGHPTQKPESLISWLIRTYTNKGETVYDGYSGSGTTAIACIKENRNFIGAEMNKEYYDKSMERIKIEQSQLVLF